MLICEMQQKCTCMYYIGMTDMDSVLKGKIGC